jgi:hypothetical protein
MKKDLWLENLQKASAEGLPDYNKAAGLNVEGQFRDLVRIDESDDSEIPDAADAVIQKSKGSVFLKSSGVADERWDAPLGKAAAASTFPQRSKERFEKCAAAIKKVFGDSEEFDEAIGIARRVLNEARAEILVRASE